MKMPQDSTMRTSAAAMVSIGRNPRAAAAPTPMSNRIATTRPSRSIVSPNSTRLAVGLAQPLQQNEGAEEKEDPAQQARHIARPHTQRSPNRIVARDDEADERNGAKKQARKHVFARNDLPHALQSLPASV